MTSIQVTITRKPGVITPPPPTIQLYQYGDDYQVLGDARACAAGGCPAVMVLRDAPDTEFDMHWQFFVYAINEGMSVNAIIAVMGNSKALFNNTGFGTSPGRANYISGNNLSGKPPRLDKLRTFALTAHAGGEVNSLAVALAAILETARATLTGRASFAMVRSSLVSLTAVNALEVKTFDGNNPPPMIPGRPRPQTLANVRLEDYLITPERNPELFMDCTNVAWKANPKRLGYGPFANGAKRSWLPDDRIHSFFPLVSKYRVVSPLKNWIKLPAGSAYPSPFRS